MPDNVTNNRDRQFSVTTSMISMFDENSNQLRLSGLESGLTVSIWLPQVSPEGKMSYPREMRIDTIMQVDSVASLNWLIRNRVVPDWQAGKDFKYGVPCNRSMTNVIDIIGESGEIYLRISRDIDENRIAKNVYQFKFVNTPVLINFDPNSGNFEIDKVPAQFTMFTEVIAAYNAVTACAQHGARVGMKFNMSSMFKYLQAVSAKLGVTVENSYRSNPGFTNTNNNSYGSNPQTNGYNGQMQEVSSLNALLG